jgi:hypothetical protein
MLLLSWLPTSLVTYTELFYILPCTGYTSVLLIHLLFQDRIGCFIWELSTFPPCPALSRSVRYPGPFCSSHLWSARLQPTLICDFRAVPALCRSVWYPGLVPSRPLSGNQPSLAREAPVSGLGTSLRSSPGISGWVRPVRQPLRLRSRQPLRFRILAISKSHSLPR